MLRVSYRQARVHFSVHKNGEQFFLSYPSPSPLEDRKRNRTKFSHSNCCYMGAGAKPRVIDGRGLSASRAEEEAASIHQENLATLSGMSQEEILAEQQQLLKTLGKIIH